MRHRILFVDDEPLMREFYTVAGTFLGPEYEIFTASSGREGLELLEQTPMDIVVSDLAMPQMSGAEFMTSVMHGHPETMRIVISGHADQLTVAQCLMFGHRYFHKPFDVRTLTNVLKRICQLKQLVSNDKIKRIISGLGALPTPPERYVRLMEALNSELTTIEDIAAIVKEDPGLTVKLLQIVNSAAFGVSRKITSIPETIQIIGFQILRAIMLTVQAFKFYEGNALRSLSLTQLWNHSLRTAIAAERLARFECLPSYSCEEAFVAGLLHDIGKLILAANADEEYESAFLRSRAENRPMAEVERDAFGATHAQIGAYLLGLWGIPEAIINTVELHESPNNDTSNSFSPVTALHIAQCLDPSETRIGRIDHAYLERLGMADRIPEWQKALKE
ncbi:MAG: HDOD domain-containing protein [Verrucomicrobiota bacterium]